MFFKIFVALLGIGLAESWFYNTSWSSPLHRITRQAGAGKAKAHCVMRINEFNTDTNRPEPYKYIELRRFCLQGRKSRRTTVKHMTKYYIVLIRANPPAVTFFANLDGHYLNDDYIFTIGDSTVPNIEMDIAHGNVMSIYKNEGSPYSLPPGDDSPYGILLLDSPKQSDVARFMLDYNRFSGKYVEKPISMADIDYIINYEELLKEDDPPFLLDFVVYGRKVHVSSCTIFDNLWKNIPPIEGNKKYLLRDWDIPGEIVVNLKRIRVNDYSLNRCTPSTTGFSPTSFQYDLPSPGRENPCKGVSFFVEDVINRIVPVATVETSSIPGCSADNPNVPEGRYGEIMQHRLGEYRELLMSSVNKDPDNVDMQIDCADEAMEIASNNGEIEDGGGTPTALTIGGTSWNNDWITAARKYFPNDGMILVDPDVQQWLRITIPGETTPISFHCAACDAFFKDGMGNIIKKKHIMTPKGYFHDKPQKNSQQITKHLSNDVHISAMNYQFQLALARSEEERNIIRRNTEELYEETLAPTAKMIRTVFAEILSETPFMYHEMIVNLQRINGINLGTHHYHEKAAAEITKIISDTMHTTLLKHLIKNNKPFSLIVDTSTTKRNIPLLICYITTLEDGYPTTYFYRIIDLKQGESAQSTFDSFWSYVLKDDSETPGFRHFFSTKIAFFVSDSASVMTGLYNSFYVKLKDVTPNKKLGKVGCLAHKMALVIKAAVRDKNDEDLAFVTEFEKHLNGFYVFYNSRGSKRFQHLAETAEKFDMHLFRLRKNIEVRWAAAEYEVIDNIIKDWEAIEKDLKDIAKDTTNFNKNARDQAGGLYTTLTDITTNVLYYEFLDFLDVNSMISKALQSRASMLADNAKLILAGFTHYFLGQYGHEGNRLTNFLKEITCSGVCEIGKCTLPQVEECDEPIFRNVALKRKNEFKFYPVRAKFYQKLFEAMSDYFDYDLLESMKIFDHRLTEKIPDRNEYIQHFQRVCKELSIENESQNYPGINCNELSYKGYDFIVQVMENPLYKGSFGRFSSLPPSQFLPFVLQNLSGKLNIDPQLKVFYEYMLVFSDSSAEAERGFSFVNRISKDARAGLGADTIDALIRIKINANKPIEDFKAYSYAKEFAKNHYLVDSTQAGGRKPRSGQRDPHAARASRLF